MAGVLVTRQFRPLTEAALLSLAVAACYYAAGRLGLLGRLVVEGVVVTPIWPPTGVAVAALLLLGARVWPGIALGSFLVIASLTTPGLTTVVTVVSNTAAPLCAFLLLRQVGFRLDMARLRDGLSLVFLGGFGAMLISSTAGVGLHVATGSLDKREFWAVWLAWWAGDTMGCCSSPRSCSYSRARPDGSGCGAGRRRSPWGSRPSSSYRWPCSVR